MGSMATIPFCAIEMSHLGQLYQLLARCGMRDVYHVLPSYAISRCIILLRWVDSSR